MLFATTFSGRLASMTWWAVARIAARSVSKRSVSSCRLSLARPKWLPLLCCRAGLA
jgi:hypothetical protein